MKKTIVILAALLTFGTLQGTAVAVMGVDHGIKADPATNLVWLKDANCFGKMSFNSAWAKSRTLATGACGLSDRSKAGDWRLPTSSELAARYANKTGFSNIRTDDYYWSMTFEDKCEVFSVDMNSGRAVTCREEGYVWPVRAK